MIVHPVSLVKWFNHVQYYLFPIAKQWNNTTFIYVQWLDIMNAKSSFIPVQLSVHTTPFQRLTMQRYQSPMLNGYVKMEKHVFAHVQWSNGSIQTWFYGLNCATLQFLSCSTVKYV